MKKFLMLLTLTMCFVLPCAFTLTGCGGKSDKKNDTKQENTDTNNSKVIQYDIKDTYESGECISYNIKFTSENNIVFTMTSKSGIFTEDIIYEITLNKEDNNYFVESVNSQKVIKYCCNKLIREKIYSKNEIDTDYTNLIFTKSGNSVMATIGDNIMVFNNTESGNIDKTTPIFSGSILKIMYGNKNDITISLDSIDNIKTFICYYLYNIYADNTLERIIPNASNIISVTYNGENFAPITEGEYNVVVTYDTNKTINLCINVTDDSESENDEPYITFSSMYNLNFLPKGADLAECLSSNNCKLRLSTESEYVPVTIDMISGFDANKIGKQILTITYKGHIETYSIRVYDPDNLTIMSDNIENELISVKKGENLVFALNVTMSDGTYNTIYNYSEGITIENFNKDVPGIQRVKVTYTDYVMYIPVYVYDEQHNIPVNCSSNDSYIYVIDNNLNTDIKIEYADGTSKIISATENMLEKPLSEISNIDYVPLIYTESGYTFITGTKNVVRQSSKPSLAEFLSRVVSGENVYINRTADIENQIYTETILEKKSTDGEYCLTKKILNGVNSSTEEETGKIVEYNGYIRLKCEKYSLKKYIFKDLFEEMIVTYPDGKYDDFLVMYKNSIIQYNYNNETFIEFTNTNASERTKSPIITITQDQYYSQEYDVEIAEGSDFAAIKKVLENDVLTLYTDGSYHKILVDKIVSVKEGGNDFTASTLGIHNITVTYDTNKTIDLVANVYEGEAYDDRELLTTFDKHIYVAKGTNLNDFFASNNYKLYFSYQEESEAAVMNTSYITTNIDTNLVGDTDIIIDYNDYELFGYEIHVYDATDIKVESISIVEDCLVVISKEIQEFNVKLMYTDGHEEIKNSSELDMFIDYNSLDSSTFIDAIAYYDKFVSCETKVYITSPKIVKEFIIEPTQKIHLKYYYGYYSYEEPYIKYTIKYMDNSIDDTEYEFSSDMVTILSTNSEIEKTKKAVVLFVTSYYSTYEYAKILVMDVEFVYNND